MRPTNYSAGSQFKGKVFIPVIKLEFRSRLNRNITLLFTIVIALCVFILLMLFLPIVLALGLTAVTAIFCFLISYYVLEHIDDRVRESKAKLFYYDRIKKYRKIIDSKGEQHFIPGKKEGEIYEGKTIL